MNKLYQIRSLKQVAVFLICFIAISGFSQQPVFTRHDTLRGSVTPERAWWDLNYYHLDIFVNPADSSIQGKNLVRYKVLESKQILQIDLQEPMKITKVEQTGRELTFAKDGNAWFISLPETKPIGQFDEVVVSYEGKPKVSKRPPWDGGIAWKTDQNGKPFVASACQGDGASLWWPCKDHMYDEPDSMLISVTVPEDLMDVSNGRLRNQVLNADGTRTFHWFVSNPINNYGVNINIGDYVHFVEVFHGEKGDLDCDYYVLKYNLDKAKKHFKEVPRMLKAFEHWFGPYPFYEDSYKLVEVPYPGMEHQSSVTYGNGFKNGFMGRDISQTGWGDKFDFIIVHESGHEWFANNITYRDIADMWVHESFIAYSEGLFVEYYWGKEAGAEYLRGVRSNIGNDRPIVGYYDVNFSGSGDMYPKGANMLHTLRQIVGDDEKWRGLLRGLNEKYYHQTVWGKQIEDFLVQNIESNLNGFFDQYLRDTRIPTLEYRFFGNRLEYRWTNCVKNFEMPLKVKIDGKEIWLNPTAEGGFKDLKNNKKHTLEIDPDFYVAGFEIAP